MNKDENKNIEETVEESAVSTEESAVSTEESAESVKKNVVKPDFNAGKTQKKSMDILDERRILDDMNSTLVKSSQAEKAASKKETKQEENNAETKSKKKLDKKAKIAVICAVAGLFVILIGILMLREFTKGPEISIVPVDVSDYVATSDNVIELGDEEYKAPVENIGASEIDKAIEIGTYVEEETVVNVQKSVGDGYKDYKAPRYWGLTSLDFGYHKVATEIEKVNAEQGSKYSIGDESSFKEKEKPVMFTVDMMYPENYPSNLGDNKVTSIPDISIKILGNPYIDDKASSSDVSSDLSSDEESKEQNEESTDLNSSEVEQYTDYISHDDVKYSCKINSVTVKPSAIDIKSGYKFKFVTTMLSGTKADDYIIEVKVGDKVEYYKGIDIE